LLSSANPDLSNSIQDRSFRFFSGRVDPGLSYFDTAAVIEADRIETSGVLQNGCLSDEICSAACLEHFLSWLVFTVHHAPPRKYYTATRLPPVPVSDM